MKKMTLAFGMFALCAGMCGATEYFVDKNRPDDSGAGTSEATAFKTIQAAVAQAAAGDTVTVLPGEYAETPVDITDGDATSYTSKSRLWIKRRITLRSRDGAASTHIVGAYDPDSSFDGMGDNAVRCITVQKEVGAVIQGFTLRDGASRGTSSTRSDSSRHRAGAVNTTSGVGNASTYTIVDCVVSNCVGTRGGALYGGTAVRCLLIGNKASNFGCAARQCALYNCVITRNDITPQGSGDLGIVAYPYAIVNCTFVANGSLSCIVQMSATGGPVYNTLFVNNVGGVGDTTSKNSQRFYNCVMPDSTLAGQCTDCVQGNAFELMNPLFGDYRLVTGAKSLSAGSASRLSQIPEAYRDKDFYGDARTTDGAVYVGAVQRVGNPVSTIKFDNYMSINGSILVNGSVILSSTPQYASTDTLPAMIRVEAVPKVSGGVTNCPVRYWRGPDRVWPSLDDSATMLFPRSGTQTVYVVCAPTCHVDPDPAVGSDETGDGSPSAPYNTIQHAIDANRTADVVILAREGVYDKGGFYSSQWGVTNRVAVWPADNVCMRVKAVGDRTKTIIMGASDPNSPDGTGCGPAAVRCVFLHYNQLLQGFTLKGGRTGYIASYTDGEPYRGGGMWGSPTDYAATLADCVVTDCCASRGAAAFGGHLERCVITNNAVAGTGNAIIRNGIARACLIADNYANTAFVIGQNQIIYQCTVASNRFNTSGTWRYTLYNDWRSLNCVVGTSVNAVRIYNESKGTIANSLLETSSLLDSWTECVADNPLFASPSGGGWKLYGCSAAVTLGNPSTMVSPLDVDGVPYSFNADGSFPAGCYASTLPAIRAVTTYADGISPSGVIPVSASGEVTFSAGLDRPFLRFEVNGEDVGYTEAGGVRSYTLSYDPAAAVGWVVKAVYGTDWYVDAGELGSDSNNGYTPATPFKTLAFAMKKAKERDTVNAAPGTYDAGYAKNGYNDVWMPWNNINLKSRVFIPAGRRLVATQGADVTFIKGAPDTTSEGRDEYGRGTDAIRGVAMAQNTLLKGFTVMDGRAGCVNSEHFDNDGGGIYGYDGSSVVEDCVISNNAAYRGGGIRKGTVRRCRIVCNRSISMGAGPRDVVLYDSLIDGNTGGTAVYAYRICGCTIGPNNTGVDGVSASGCYAALDGCYLVNNLFCGGSVQTRFASNCVFRTASQLSGMMTDSYWRGGNDPEALGLKAGDGTMPVDAGYRPVKGSIAIDAASRTVQYACTNEFDLAGGQRIYNNALDCGCFEYDWRGDYSRLLTTSGRFAVTSAPPACVAAPAGVLLIDGTLRSAWSVNGNRALFSVKVAVTGGGVLRVLQNGTEVASLVASDGEQTLEYWAADNGLDFVYARADNDADSLGALISSVTSYGGTTIIIR